MAEQKNATGTDFTNKSLNPVEPTQCVAKLFLIFLIS